MADVNNPGLVEVANQTYGNPDPNGGSVLLVPKQDDVLVAAAKQGFSPAANGVSARVFPTPSEVQITGTPTVPVTNSSAVPQATQVNVDDQVLGQGVWVYVDPMNPAAGKRFVPPAEFVVVGPATSFQTNKATATTVLCTITAVYDADNLWNVPSANTTRYLLVVAPPPLTGYPISILGRQIIFADDTTTAGDQGAARFITGYSTNYVVIDKNDPLDQLVPSLDEPVIGDTFLLDIERQGSEEVNDRGPVTVDVVILPPPPLFVPDPNQALLNQGDQNISTGPQPGAPILTSGTQVPSAITVQVADQATSVGLPKNVNVP